MRELRLMLDQITPVILTFDEAPNIGRVLERLTWARDVVVVDSGSTDGTQAICAEHANVRLFTRPFDNHANQWNFAVGATDIGSDWILALDADFILTEPLIAELAALTPPAAVTGYWLSFRYAMMGKVLRSGVYPPLLALYRRGRGTYAQDGHTQRAVVDGQTSRLTNPALHDDRKPLSRWLRSQGAYAQLEADKLAGQSGGLKAWLRGRTPLAPLAMGAYCLIWRGGLFEGPAGWAYALQRMIAEAMISAAVLDRKLRKS